MKSKKEVKEIREMIVGGKTVLLDEEDYQKIPKKGWYLITNRPAKRMRLNDRLKVVYMHRLIIKTTPDKMIDHINGNKLDNRKCNLRICNNSQNLANHKKYSNNKSGFTGVYWNKYRNRWQAGCRKNNVTKYIGLYSSIYEAGMAYNIYARILHKKFAIQNDVMNLLYKDVVERVVNLSSKYWIDRPVGSPTPLVVNKKQFEEFILSELSCKQND